jgi:peptide/nickel transport system substrate-binding protein
MTGIRGRAALGLLAVVAMFASLVAAAGARTAVPQSTAKEGGTLTIALAEDPDALDPTLARTFVGRMVFLAICEKLYDLNSKLQIVPQLAAALPKVSADKRTVTIRIKRGIRFNDGTALDASAVKTSLDRHRTLTGSRRASEISPVTSVDVVNKYTVALHLNEPFAPLAAQLADRAGMIMSPTQLTKLGTRFATNPVCVGPFQFSDRVPLDHITVTKSAFYYAKKKVHFNKIVFRIINEPTAAAAALRAHDVDVLDRIGPTVLPSIRSDRSLHVIQATSIGYQGITINIGNKNGLLKLPYSQNVGTALSSNNAIRQAFELAIDRDRLNKVVWQGTVKPGCGPLAPNSPWFPKIGCNIHRDLKKAKSLVARSGIRNPSVRLMIGNDSDQLRLGQFLQSEEEEAGIRVELQPTEFVSSLAKADAGNYDAFAIGWSGRIDPDGNIFQFVATRGAQNDSGYSNPRLDVILNNARHATTRRARMTLYRAAVRIIRSDRPLIYLWHAITRHGVSNKVKGIKVYGDGLIRAEFGSFK